MEKLPYLVAAYAVIWVSLGAYLWFIASRQKSIRREIEGLRALLDEQNKKLGSK